MSGEKGQESVFTKKNQEPLALEPHTIAMLTDAELRQANGGWDPSQCAETDCKSDSLCSQVTH